MHAINRSVKKKPLLSLSRLLFKNFAFCASVRTARTKDSQQFNKIQSKKMD
jgi:hypothetical protein